MSKKTFLLVRMEKLTALHMGWGGSSYDRTSDLPASDALSAALAASLAMQGHGEDTIMQFLDDLRISSAFPYSSDSYFFPVPKGRLNAVVEGMEEEVYRKALKKIRYVDKDLFQQILRGEQICIASMDYLCGSFLLSDLSSSFAVPYASGLRQRVAVSRTGEDDACPFFFEWLYFTSTSGLFCLVSISARQESLFRAAFRLLGDNGLGTGRSIGGGAFVPSFGSMDMDIPEESSHRLLLSTYIPARDELERIRLEASSYSILKREGFAAGCSDEDLRHLRRKSIHMFDAASSLATHLPLDGRVVDLTPDWDTPIHPIYRSGKALDIPYNPNK